MTPIHRLRAQMRREATVPWTLRKWARPGWEQAGRASLPMLLCLPGGRGGGRGKVAEGLHAARGRPGDLGMSTTEAIGRRSVFGKHAHSSKAGLDGGPVARVTQLNLFWQWGHSGAASDFC